MRWTSLIAGLATAATLAFASISPALAKEPAAPVQDIVDAHPALWVVKDDDTTIYLFGTIHLMKPGIRWFEGPVRSAYDGAQQIVLEVASTDDADDQSKIMRRAMAIDAPTITSRLPEASREKYLTALSSHGLAPILFDRVKPWFATLTLSVLPLRSYGYDPENGVDHMIKLAAIADGKTLTGLETADEQIGFFEGLPEDLQLALLAQTLDELPKLGETISQMIAAWSAGEPEQLAKLMNESVDANPELEKRLLTDRNARWADWIKQRLNMPGTVFMAVGAGHLAGSNSVQDMLEARGIPVSRIERGD